MAWNEIVASILLCLGAFFTVTGAVGILRMPDFYSRIHPAGKSDTLGMLLITVGLMFLVNWLSVDWLVASKLVLIVIFVLITAPTATHAITRAAWLDGVKPWTGNDANPTGDAPLPEATEAAAAAQSATEAKPAEEPEAKAGDDG